MLSNFALKIIALFCMTCDHIADSLLVPPNYLNVIGRLAFPIFAFQITEGYIHTKSLKKYFIRLIIFAIISQLPFMLFSNTFGASFSLNIFFTLSLGLLAIYLYNKISNKFLGVFFGILISIIASLLHTDYGAFGVLIIMIFYIFKDKKVLMTTAYTFICILYFLDKLILTNFSIICILLLVATILSIIFILLYNGKQGKKFKYFFYIYYPLHLLLLYLAHTFLLN